MRKPRAQLLITSTGLTWFLSLRILVNISVAKIRVPRYFADEGNFLNSYFSLILPHNSRRVFDC